MEAVLTEVSNSSGDHPQLIVVNPFRPLQHALLISRKESGIF
jgi:hypothetical protein